MQNIYLKNVHGYTAWDFDNEVLSGTYEDCYVTVANNGNTSNVLGGHAIIVGYSGAPATDTNYYYKVIRGGIYNVSGFNTIPTN